MRTSPKHCNLRVWSLVSAMALGLLCSIAQATTGDRLVLAVNGSPYTQRSVESRILVRESLRSDNKGAVPLITATSWAAAMDAFIEDAMIHQEAQRLGSFQPSEAAMRRARDEFTQRQSRDPEFAKACARLEIDELTLDRLLNAILLVEAFRRSKERQVAASARGGDGLRTATADSNDADDADDVEDGDARGWLAVLRERSVVRTFAGAETWIAISPRREGSAEGSSP